MADAAGYSLFHFCRVFARCTRMSPYTYLIRRRLTLAADQVLGSSRRIVDVGTGLGFDTHDGFTRAFTRLYGVTPSESRQVGDVAASRRLPRLTTAHLVCLERHGGRTADPPDDAGRPVRGDVEHLALPVRWPERPEPDPYAESARTAVAARPAAVTLADDADLLLVLDWLHHVWLVAERLDLAVPQVGIERIEPAPAIRVLLRVVPWVPGAHRRPPSTTADKEQVPARR